MAPRNAFCEDLRAMIEAARAFGRHPRAVARSLELWWRFFDGIATAVG